MGRSQPRGPYAKGIRRRQEIVDRAMAVFAERGNEGTSLRAVALELDIEHSTIHHYFDSIETLKLAVIEAYEARTGAEVDQRDPGTLWEQFHHTAEIDTGIPGLIALYTSMLGASVEPNNQHSRAKFQGRFSAARAAMAAAIEEGRRTGVTPPGPDAHAIAALVLAAFDGLQVQWLLDSGVDLPASLQILEPLIGRAPAAQFVRASAVSSHHATPAQV